MYFCNDMKERVGSYCSRGKCNLFGCDCDGGCIERSKKRRLMQAGGESGPLQFQGPSDPIGACQEKMVEIFNTTNFRNKEQIQSYFDCLQTVKDGLLNFKDDSIVFLNETLSGIARLKRMDTDNNGNIEPSEFDKDLVISLQTSSAPSTILHGKVILLIILSIMCLSF